VQCAAHFVGLGHIVGGDSEEIESAGMFECSPNWCLIFMPLGRRLSVLVVSVVCSWFARSLGTQLFEHGRLNLPGM
jgi:hypothetical protein